MVAGTRDVRVPGSRRSATGYDARTNACGARPISCGARRTIYSDRNDLQPETDRLQRERDRLQRVRDRLRKQIGRLKEALAAARRAGYQQAAPFAKDRRQGRGGRSDRRAGSHYGRHGCRQRPRRVDETHTARTPGCPNCGGSVTVELVATQYQRETFPRCVRSFAASTSRSATARGAGGVSRAATRYRPPMRWERPARNSARGRCAGGRVAHAPGAFRWRRSLICCGRGSGCASRRVAWRTCCIGRPATPVRPTPRCASRSATRRWSPRTKPGGASGRSAIGCGRSPPRT